MFGNCERVVRMMDKIPIWTIPLLLLTLLMISGPSYQQWFPPEPSVQYVTCEEENNCTSRFPEASGISCSIHHQTACTKTIALDDSQRTSTVRDLSPYLSGINIYQYEGFESLNFTFTLPMDDVVSGRTQGVRAEFQTLDKRTEGDRNGHYSTPTCRYFNFTSTQPHPSFDPDDGRGVELSYPCSGIGIDPDDFRLTLTSLPSSTQLVYDVKWTNWLPYSPDSIWRNQVVAVAVVHSTVYVVFEPPNLTSGVRGVQVSLIRGPEEVFNTLVPTEAAHSQVKFSHVLPNYYQVMLTPVGSPCVHGACPSFKSLPVFVDSPDATASPQHYDMNHIISIVAITFLASLLLIILCRMLYRKLRGLRCISLKFRPITVVSTTRRTLEAELLDKLGKILEKCLPDVPVTCVCPHSNDFSDSSRSCVSSVRENLESDIFFPKNTEGGNNSERFQLTSSSIVVHLKFDNSSLFCTDDASSDISPYKSEEFDFLKELCITSVKPKNLINLSTDCEEIRPETLSSVSAGEEHKERNPKLNKQTKEFELSADTHRCLSNVYECVQYLRERSAPSITLIDKQELCTTSVWTEFDVRLKKILDHPWHNPIPNPSSHTKSTKGEALTVVCSQTFSNRSFSNLTEASHDMGLSSASESTIHLQSHQTQTPTNKKCAHHGQHGTDIPKEFANSILPPE